MGRTMTMLDIRAAATTIAKLTSQADTLPQAEYTEACKSLNNASYHLVEYLAYNRMSDADWCAMNAHIERATVTINSRTV